MVLGAGGIRSSVANLLCRHRWSQCRSNSSVKNLQAAFRDPSSPFHLPPGSTGPASPDEAKHIIDDHKLEKAQEAMSKAGFPAETLWAQKIVWGDHDSFQHVNNVRYEWMRRLGSRLGGPENVDALIRGKGVSLILKSISVQFKRPVTYPDTLLIGHQILPQGEVPTGERPDPSAIFLTASAYSIEQSAFVAHAKEVIVWYDYDKLRKCDPGDKFRSVAFTTI